MDGKGSIIFWGITDESDAFVSCSNDPTFQSFFDPGTSTSAFFNQFKVNTLFAYLLSQDGTSATEEACGSTDPNSCATTSSVFQVAGDQLLFAETQNIQFNGTTACQMQDSRNWTLTDNGTTLGMAVSDALSLIGDATTCSQLDQQQKSQSPNGLGIQGCIVNFTMSASLAN
jgi:hypothetical protein